MLIAVMFILPKKWSHKAIQDKKKGSFIQILKIPGVAVVGICTLTGGTLISFFDLTVAVQLHQITDRKITVFHCFLRIQCSYMGLSRRQQSATATRHNYRTYFRCISIHLYGACSFATVSFTATAASTAFSACVWYVFGSIFYSFNWCYA